MRSFICSSLISNPASRNKRLALLLLVSFCLTYMGQAFATPMICMMPANAQANAASPCHHKMSESVVSTQLVVKSSAMDCCDDKNIEDERSTISSHNCSCLDGSSGTSLIFLASFSCSSLNISELPYHYSAIGFPNQIDSALFRPPIA
jgi:hypothetical protein